MRSLRRRGRLNESAEVRACRLEDRLSAAILQRRCAYWVRRLVPTFNETERAVLQPGYRYCMAQMELATDIVFKRAAPLQAMFQRACELGVLVGGADRTTQLFGRPCPE